MFQRWGTHCKCAPAGVFCDYCAVYKVVAIEYVKMVITIAGFILLFLWVVLYHLTTLIESKAISVTPKVRVSM
jgi:hypothetical protein